MDLNIENISRLDNNSSYYLSDNGEIKKSGLLHKFKCFFGLGHSRQRVSNLINAIRNTILEASGGAAQGKFEEDLSGISQKSAVKGSVIKQFAENYRNTNHDKIARALAKKEAAGIINSTILELEAKGKSKIKNSPNLQRLLNKALENDLDEPPLKNKDGRNVLDIDAFRTSISQKTNEICNLLLSITDSEKLGKPTLSNDYFEYLENEIFNEEGELRIPQLDSLKSPDEAFAKIVNDNLLSEEYTAEEKNRLEEGCNLILKESKDDPDLRDLLTLHYQTLLKSGDEVRSIASLKNKIDAMKQNLTELRELSSQNTHLFAYGKKVMSGNSFLTFAPGVITKMFNYVNSADINELMSLNSRSTASEIQKALSNISSMLVSGASESGADLSDIVKVDFARTFIAGMLSLRLDPALRQTLVKVFESTEFSRVEAAYSQLQNSVTANTELPHQIRNLYASTTLSIGRTIDSLYTSLCSVTGKDQNTYKYLGEVDDKLVSQIYSDIKKQTDPYAERAINEFLERHFKGASLGFIQEYVKNMMLKGKLRAEGSFNPAQLFSYMVTNKVNNYINLNFIDSMKKLTGTNPEEAAFFRDLGRMSVSLPDGKTLSQEPGAAADELSAFVTGRADAKFTALSDEEKAKVRVVMSLLTTNTAKAVIESAPSELDKTKSLKFNEAPDSGKFTISLDKFGNNIRIKGGYENEITSFVHNQKQSVLNPGSTVKGEVLYSISSSEIDRLAKLDYSEISNTQANISENFRIKGTSSSVFTVDIKE